MTAILGYFHRDFQTSYPRKLCRRRERWIESPPTDESSPLIYRLVISASARPLEEERTFYGLEASGFNIAQIIGSLFENSGIYAWTEESPSSQTPQDASGVEFFEVSRPGVPLRTWFSRWELKCESSEDITRARGLGSDVLVINPIYREPSEPVQPIMPLADLFEGGDISYRNPDLSEKLRDALFFLTGQREGGDSMERYLPAAIDDILECAEAVVLFHADRDSDCVAIYAKSELHPQIERLQAYAASEAFVLSPFEVPPMVARWERVWRQHQEQEDVNSSDTVDSDESEDSDSESHEGAASSVLEEVGEIEPIGDSEVEPVAAPKIEAVDEESEELPALYPEESPEIED